jgi:UDP-3-O-[3-hydroxymyristoyl] glucosamine N-acyltransferase
MTCFTLDELAERFGLSVTGAGSTPIEGVCSLSPGHPGQLAFCADSKLRPQLASTQAAAVVIRERDTGLLTVPALVAPDPAAAFARIASLWDRYRAFSAGIHPQAVIDATASLGRGCGIGPGSVIDAQVELGEDVFVGPNCVIRRGVRIGKGSRLESGVYVGIDCVLGERAQVQPGAVIGGRGFGLVPTRQGWLEMPQLGRVVIGNDVEIGANTCIDRGALDDTVIEDGVKLDNQIQIAHNCRIGAGTAIAAAVGIAGSTTIGKRCLIGGAVGIGGHLTIADDVVLLAGTMVSGSIDRKGAYGSTMTALPVRDWRKMVARFRRWMVVENRLRVIERHLKISEKQNLTEGYGIDEATNDDGGSE